VAPVMTPPFGFEKWCSSTTDSSNIAATSIARVPSWISTAPASKCGMSPAGGAKACPAAAGAAGGAPNGDGTLAGGAPNGDGTCGAAVAAGGANAGGGGKAAGAAGRGAGGAAGAGPPTGEDGTGMPIEVTRGAGVDAAGIGIEP